MSELGYPKVDHTYIRLYERTLAMCPLYKDKFAGKDFFEISCGHSGGLEWFEKAHNWKSCRGSLKVRYNITTPSQIGLDINPLDPDGVRVIKGDACNMPLPDNSVDIALNCEASHTYGDSQKFMQVRLRSVLNEHKHFVLQEVFRILRPGGYFCWSDLRFSGYYTDLPYSDARDAGLKVRLLIVFFVHVCSFTVNKQEECCEGHSRFLGHTNCAIPRVVQAQVVSYLSIIAFLTTSTPKHYRYTRFTYRFWINFWGVPGSATNNDFKAGRWTYYAACWQKPE